MVVTDWGIESRTAMIQFVSKEGQIILVSENELTEAHRKSIAEARALIDEQTGRLMGLPPQIAPPPEASAKDVPPTKQELRRRQTEQARQFFRSKGQRKDKWQSGAKSNGRRR